MTEPIRVFVGTEPKTTIAAKVLESSILRRTTYNVEFTWMDGPGWEMPEGVYTGTGFSLRRWMIPEKCNHEGLAIYQDADQIVLGDIAELWSIPKEYPDNGSGVWLTYQPDKWTRFKSNGPKTCVMLMDCSVCRWDNLWSPLKPGSDHMAVAAYHDFMHCTWMAKHPNSIPMPWNHLNKYKPGTTKVLHYTIEHRQPMYQPEHELSKVWEGELIYALQSGRVKPEEIAEACDQYQKHDPKVRRSSQGMHPYWRKYAA